MNTDVFNPMTLQFYVDFIRLSSGQWAGHTSEGVRVSIQHYEKGERPDRFKYELAKPATTAQTEEYWIRHAFLCDEYTKEYSYEYDDYDYVKVKKIFTLQKSTVSDMWGEEHHVVIKCNGKVLIDKKYGDWAGVSPNAYENAPVEINREEAIDWMVNLL